MSIRNSLVHKPKGTLRDLTVVDPREHINAILKQDNNTGATTTITSSTSPTTTGSSTSTTSGSSGSSSGGQSISQTIQSSGSSLVFYDQLVAFDSVISAAANFFNGQLYYQLSVMDQNIILNNVIAIELESFRIPRINGPYTSPDLFFSRKLYIRLTSLNQNTATLSTSYNYYHYDADIVNPNATSMLCNPNNAALYMNHPTSQLTDFGFQFFTQSLTQSALIPVNLPNLQDVVRPVPGSNPATFTFVTGSLYDLITPVNQTFPLNLVGSANNLVSQVAVWFSAFVCNDATVTSQVNTPYGLLITSIPSATTFVVGALSFATVTAPTNPTDWDSPMLIQKNRINMTVRFTMLDKTSTSGYLTPVLSR